jgi:hypothetical protein
MTERRYSNTAEARIIQLHYRTLGFVKLENDETLDLAQIYNLSIFRSTIKLYVKEGGKKLRHNYNYPNVPSRNTLSFSVKIEA